MSRYRLLVSSFAELDLQIAFDWYELQKEGLGVDFIYEVEKTIFRIKSNPDGHSSEISFWHLLYH
jgi:hypothetical protein